MSADELQQQLFKLTLSTENQTKVSFILEGYVKLINGTNAQIADATRLKWHEGSNALWLKEGLSRKNPVTIKKDILKLIAELAKDEATREFLGPLLLSPMCHVVLSDPDLGVEDLSIQLFRAFANLCYEHEIHRDIIAEHAECVSRLFTTIKMYPEELKPIGFSSLFNISMDNEVIQSQIAECEGVEYLLNYLDGLDLSQSSRNPASAALLLSNLLESDMGINAVQEQNNLSMFLKVLFKMGENISASHDNVEGLTDAFESLVEALEYLSDREFVQRSLVSTNSEWFSKLIDIVDIDANSRLSDEEDIDRLIEMQCGIVKCLTLISAHDEAMKLFEHSKFPISAILNWIKPEGELDRKIRVEKQMSASLIIGNLARSDTTCKLLAESPNVLLLLQSLIDEQLHHISSSNQIQENLRDTIRILHAALGAIKNLSISASERVTLAKKDELVVSIIHIIGLEILDAVHFTCVGIFRNLTLSTEKKVYLKILDPSILKAGISVYSVLVRRYWEWASDDQKSLRTETGRLMVALVKASILSKDTESAEKLLKERLITVLMQIFTGGAYTNASYSSGAQAVNYKAHSLSAGPVYPVVQNEALVALILLAEFRPALTAEMQGYVPSLISTLTEILHSAKKEIIKQGVNPDNDDSVDTRYSDEVRINAVLLLYHILLRDPNFASKCPQSILEYVLLLKSRLASCGTAAVSKQTDVESNASSQAENQQKVLSSLISYLK